MPTLLFVVRGVKVTILVTLHVVVWLVGWIFLLLTLRAKTTRQSWFGRRLAVLFVDLGATFVKLGQIMSTRPDLFPPHVIAALAKLQDDVGAFAYRHIERTFVEEFGKTPDELFVNFERRPIASASVAQVHRASLADGTDVAVKVRRPGLEHIVAFDFRVMGWFARAMCIVPSARLFAPVESVAQFARAIRMQIDLSIEADNNRRFHHNFANKPDVAFPVLVDDMCTKRVLTMSFVDGVKILDHQRVETDPTRLAKIGFHTLLKMVFEDGFVHADLHPGNMLIVPGTDEIAAGDYTNARVAILDLGLVAELDQTHRVAFARYFAGWAQGNGKIMAKLMYELSPSTHVADYDGYEADISAFVKKYYGKALGEVQVSKVAFDMMNILRKHRVRVNPTFTMCNIAIAVTEGIGKQLDASLDLMNEAIPFFMKLQKSGAMSIVGAPS